VLLLAPETAFGVAKHSLLSQKKQIEMMLFKSLAVALFLCFSVSSIQATDHHPLQILMDELGEQPTSCLLFYPSNIFFPDNGAGCSSEEITVINQHLSPQSGRRQLPILGFKDDPCTDKCRGFPPGYCFMLFCKPKPRRTLRKHHQGKEKLSEVGLSECIVDLELANDEMNIMFREQTISQGCRKLISGSRHFVCFNYE
jgi:hypothetical protein